MLEEVVAGTETAVMWGLLAIVGMGLILALGYGYRTA
jgi:hypothetical protein